MKITTIVTSMALLLLSGCKAQQVDTTSFPIFSYEGHRGARGLYPENTTAGMYKALDLGVTTLEMDAHITKDGQVVLSHDAYLNPKFVRKPTGEDIKTRDYIIYQMTYDSLKTFDTGSKDYVDFPDQVSVDEHIPLLSSLIDSVESYAAKRGYPRPFYNIETKSKPGQDGVQHPNPKTFVNLLVAVLEKKNILNRVVIQSFDPRTLQVLRKDYPSIRTSYLVQDPKKTVENNIEELGFIPFIYSPNYKLVDEKLVKTSHALGMKVIPWTANTTEEIQRLKSLHVDGIISDYPNLFNLTTESN